MNDSENVEQRRSIDDKLSQLMSHAAVQNDRQATMIHKLDTVESKMETYGRDLAKTSQLVAVMETKLTEGVNDRLDLWKAMKQGEDEITQIKQEMSTYKGIATGIGSTSKLFWAVGMALVTGLVATMGLFFKMFEMLHKLSTLVKANG